MSTKEEALQKIVGKRYLSLEVEGHGEAIFVQPSRPAYMRMMSQAGDDNISTSDSLGGFVLACAVWPVGEAYSAMLDDYPGMVSDVSSDLVDLAKPAAKAIVKKG